ncbi:MAG: anthranilate synthase component I family protein [Cyclobacteriaceae bacterium]|nr:anthranilate synthase component I family protein [Cyclobacteriaceae bacterium]
MNEVRKVWAPAIDDIPAFLQKAFKWASNKNYCHYFSPSQIDYPFGTFPECLAVGSIESIVANAEDSTALHKLQTALEKQPDWWFGFFSFELKNGLHKLHTSSKASVQVPGLHFYRPETLIFHARGKVIIESAEDPEAVYRQIIRQNNEFQPPVKDPGTISCSASEPDYIQTVEHLRKLIYQGDFYEINYCIEHLRHNISIDPPSLFEWMKKQYAAPFSVYQKTGHLHLLSASPERFLKKTGNQLISQPIKGTAPRGQNPEEDQALAEALKNSEKERAENLMITDLVRNDLARSALPGTVRVPELFGIYTFPGVHQMISTVVAEIPDHTPLTHPIGNAFPMGSMTGAPKIRVLQEIDKIEKSQRGLYSGAVGYFSPTGDFDFNVVIRSMIYDEKQQLLSYHSGSAITYDADADAEYKECMLKAAAFYQLHKI